MALITLTTDFGEKDYFVAAVKGKICQALPEVNIVDISHQISSFNIRECAFILKNAYPHFPKNSIHIVGVDTERTPENKHIAIAMNDHFFIGADNGILSLVCSEKPPEQIVEIDTPESLLSSPFPTLYTFVEVASYIAKHKNLSGIGKPLTQLREVKSFNPTIIHKNGQINGNVLYIDNYGNVVSNISKSLFENVGRGRSFKISIKNYTLHKIYHSYSKLINFDLEKNRRKGAGDLMALFNSAGFLELAIYKSNIETTGGASSLLGITKRDVVIINFN